jgi:hypothetical protein
MKQLLIFVVIALATAQTTTRTELDQKESMEVIALNQAEMDAWKVAAEAQMKYQATVANSKAVIGKMKGPHAAAGCELDRSTMRWIECKSPVEKKK